MAIITIILAALLLQTIEIVDVLEKISRTLDGIYCNPDLKYNKIADDINFSENLRHEQLIEHICHIKAILSAQDKVNGKTSKE